REQDPFQSGTIAGTRRAKCEGLERHHAKRGTPRRRRRGIAAHSRKIGLVYSVCRRAAARLAGKAGKTANRRARPDPTTGRFEAIPNGGVVDWTAIKPRSE